MMNETAQQPPLRSRRLSALTLALLYVAVAALWIWASDRVLFWLVGDAVELAFWQTLKGWFFVAFTGLLLFVERTYMERTVQQAQDALQRLSDARGNELERNRTQLQMIMDNAPVIFFLRDTEGHYLMVNRMWEQYFELRREQVLDKNPEELFSPERAAYLRQSFDEIVHKGGAITDETTIRWHDRDMYFARARFLLSDRAGVPYAVCGMLTNITDLRRADLARQAAEARFRAVFENAGIGIVLVDHHGRFVQSNPTYRRIVGYSEEQLHGLTFRDIGQPEDSAADWQAFQAMLAGETAAYQMEKRYRHAGGHEFWANITVSPLEGANGEAGLVLRMVEDITQRKQLEFMQQQAQAELERLVGERTAELERVNADLADAQRVAQVGNWRLHAATRHLTLSQQTYEIIGAPAEEFDPTPAGYLARVHPDEQEIAQRAYFAVMDGTRPLDFEHRLLLPTGEVRVVNIRGYVVRDETGAPIELFGTLQDMTQRRRMEDELRRLNQELEARVAERTLHLEQEIAERRRAEESVQELNRSLAEHAARLTEVNHELETFTYSVSHDLKAPLRGIDGYSRLLLEDYVDRLDDDGKRFLHTIRHAASHMATLIDDLLTYSRMERRQLKRMPIELSPLVATLTAELQRAHRDDKTQFEILLQEQRASGDPEALTLILRNLLDNALKFTAGVESPKITVRSVAQAGKCVISVADNGIGFDMRYHNRIFDIFQRLHRAEDYPGTGVGLAIVRKAALRINGRVWAESSPGSGATFFVELPLPELNQEEYSP